MMAHLSRTEFELIKKMQQAKTREEHDQLERELEAVLAKKEDLMFD